MQQSASDNDMLRQAVLLTLQKGDCLVQVWQPGCETVNSGLKLQTKVSLVKGWLALRCNRALTVELHIYSPCWRAHARVLLSLSLDEGRVWRSSGGAAVGTSWSLQPMHDTLCARLGNARRWVDLSEAPHAPAVIITPPPAHMLKSTIVLFQVI